MDCGRRSNGANGKRSPARGAQDDPSALSYRVWQATGPTCASLGGCRFRRAGHEEIWDAEDGGLLGCFEAEAAIEGDVFGAVGFEVARPTNCTKQTRRTRSGVGRGNYTKNSYPLYRSFNFASKLGMRRMRSLVVPVCIDSHMFTPSLPRISVVTISAIGILC
jgi:hypothetical protein